MRCAPDGGADTSGAATDPGEHERQQCVVELALGGKLIEPKQSGDNWTGTGIEGGTPQKVSKGDFVMVPAGVPHWFTDIQAPLTQMSLHLPMPQK